MDPRGTQQTWWYSVVECDEGTRFIAASPDHRFSVCGAWVKIPPDFIAAICAENYDHILDGDPSTWPLTFVLYESEEGPETGRFVVERESVANFYATRVENEEKAVAP